MTDLGGTRALVTGATSGLGLAMARALVDAGARVAITSRDASAPGAPPPPSAPAPSAWRSTSATTDAVAAGVAEVWERLGGIDLLVNNAGIGMRTVNPRFLSHPQPFWEVPPDGFRDVLETKVTGCFLMARAVVPLMLEQGGGRIVTISMSESTMVRAGLRALRAVGRGGRGVVAGDGGRPCRQPGDGQPAAARRRHRHRDGPRRHARPRPASGCSTRRSWDRRSSGSPRRRRPGSTTSGSSPPSSTSGWRRDEAGGAITADRRHAPPH